jgi:hypothetical protein
VPYFLNGRDFKLSDFISCTSHERKKNIILCHGKTKNYDRECKILIIYLIKLIRPHQFHLKISMERLRRTGQQSKVNQPVKKEKTRMPNLDGNGVHAPHDKTRNEKFGDLKRNPKYIIEVNQM